MVGIFPLLFYKEILLTMHMQGFLWLLYTSKSFLNKQNNEVPYWIQPSMNINKRVGGIISGWRESWKLISRKDVYFAPKSNLYYSRILLITNHNCIHSEHHPLPHPLLEGEKSQGGDINFHHRGGMATSRDEQEERIAQFFVITVRIWKFFACGGLYIFLCIVRSFFFYKNQLFWVKLSCSFSKNHFMRIEAQFVLMLFLFHNTIV